MKSSRARILALTAAVLLILDAGRSWHARLAAGEPALSWSAGYNQAEAIVWPPGRDVGAAAPLGARTYARHCALCHGPAGKGNGPVAASLHPRPRDFTRGVFKIKSTPGHEAPTRADLRTTIENGLQGTSMTGWADLLSETAIDAVAEHVLSLGPHESWGQAEPLPARTRQALASASAEDGAALYGTLGCPACHGDSGEGDGSAAPHLKDVWNQPDPPRNLRAPWTFRRGNGAEEIYLRIANGVSGSPMPAYSDVATPEELAAVVAYVRSIAKPPPWHPGGRLSVPEGSAPADRGRYLFRITLCSSCHTPFDEAGIYRAASHGLAGGARVDVRGHGVFVASNLTPDLPSGLGSWSREQLAEAIHTGRVAGKPVHPWVGVFPMQGGLTQADATAMATYLETVTPVRNHIPKIPRIGFLEASVARAASQWNPSPAARIVVHSGNRGSATPQAPPSRTETVLIAAQAVVLAAGLLALLVLPGAFRRGRIVGGLFALFVVFGARLFVSPSVPSSAEDAVRTVTVSGDAEAEPRRAPTTNHSSLVARGAYLYQNAGCAFCHAANAAGGAKLNWRLFGTVWAGNLTPGATGLRAWSDGAVLRFLASGVRPDGSASHWQAAVWGQSANLSVEDRRAVVAYLRALPAVQREVPAAQPPRPQDSDARVVWPRALDRLRPVGRGRPVTAGLAD
jgi:mono/diheme cytochrome c family protein